MDLLCSDLSALPIFFYLSTTSRPGMQPACHTFSFLGFSFFLVSFCLAIQAVQRLSFPHTL